MLDEPDRPKSCDVTRTIDLIGVARIANEFQISEQAVRRWRGRKQIPDDRIDAVLALLDDFADCDEVAAERQVSPAAPGCATSEVSQAGDQVAVGTTVSPAAPGCATSEVSEISGGENSQPMSDTKLPGQLNAAELEGSSAREAMALYIASRDVRMMRAIADRAADDAPGLPPVSPVRWYWLRLTILFVLDFPILTMAFVTVTEASPILAAGSAIALSLGLVLCAHVAGAQLRSLAAYIPDWLQSLSTLIIMVSLIAAVIGIAAELRHKGFEVGGIALASEAASIFAPTTELPDSLKSAIVLAAGLVTILLTVFGIAWSYNNHGPQQAFAVAEKSYRKALNRYAGAVRRSATSPRHLSAAVLLAAALTFSEGQASAADCLGPSMLTLVDTTTAVDDLDRHGLMPAIDEMVRSLRPNDRLVIRTIRDAPESSHLLLDICVLDRAPFEWSAQGLWAWLSANPSAQRAEQAHLKRSIRDAVLPVLTQQREARGTALIDTLSHFTAIDRPNTVWPLSDLLESVALPTASPNVNAVESIPLNGSAGLQLPQSCGALDPAIAISNTLGEVGGAADQLDQLLVLAATETGIDLHPTVGVDTSAYRSLWRGVSPTVEIVKFTKEDRHTAVDVTSSNQPVGEVEQLNLL